MARPNNPGSPAAGQQPQRVQGGEQDGQPAGWPPPPQALPGWPAPSQQGYPQNPPGYPSAPPQAPAADPYGAAAYHYPQAPTQHDAYLPPQPPPTRPGYAPQFERYAPPPQPHPQAQGQPPPRHQQPPLPPGQPGARPPVTSRPAEPARGYQHEQQTYHAPGAYGAEGNGYAAPPTGAEAAAMQRSSRYQAPASRQPAPDLRGTLADQWPVSPPPRAPAQPDPRGFDLGSYAAPPPPPPRQMHQPAQAAPGMDRADWQAQQQHLDRRGAHVADPALELGGYANTQFADDQPGRAVVAEQDYAHDDIEYEDEPPRRSRGLLIVGALVGAIGLGGGLAYAYKTFLGPSQTGNTPVVKADRAPARTQPAEPGGKQFANQGIKVMGGRLTEAASASDADARSRSASAGVAEDGVRRVPTVSVRPDGTMTPPVPQLPPALPPAAAGAAPPGMTFADPLRRAPPTAQPPQPAPQATASARVTSEPRTITLPPPKEAAAPVRAPAPALQQRAAIALPAEKPEAPAVVARQAAPRPPAAVAAAGSSSYVAVLASQRSSMDALKTFADLQQKYGVLQGRVPTVKEANLGEKGVYHRLVVGPPGPREKASALCSELKAAGYTGCWVTTQ